MLFPAAAQRAHQQQRKPAAHRRADYDLRPAAAGFEHGETLLKPAPDRAVGEGAAGFAVAGIIEPHASAARPRRPVRQRLSLPSLHVGLVAAEPEQTGRGAAVLAHGNRALFGPFANGEEFQVVIDHGASANKPDFEPAQNKSKATDRPSPNQVWTKSGPSLDQVQRKSV